MALRELPKEFPPPILVQRIRVLYDVSPTLSNGDIDGTYGPFSFPAV